MAEDGPSRVEIRQWRVFGRDLRILRWSPASRSNGKRPILLFNGIGANAELIAPFAEQVRDRDVVTFDMPGVGGSPAPRVPYRPWVMARCADRIMTDLGYGEIDVIGVSWGGAIAQQYAFQYRDRTASCVLVASSPGTAMVPGRLSALLKMATPRRYLDAAFLRKNAQSLYGGSPQDLLGVFEGIRGPTSSGYVHQLLAVAAWTSVPLLPFVSARTLILMGGDDSIVRPINGLLLKYLVRNARLKIVEGAGHLLLLTHLETVASVILDFLDESESR